MAATIEGRRLTEAHRLAQVRLKTATVALMLRLAPMLASDPQRWTATALVLLAPLRERSAMLAANYVIRFREVEVGDPTDVVRATALPAEVVARSLAFTGVVRLRQHLARDVPMDLALRRAAATSAAAGSRHVLNGGRETVIGATQQDNEARGWQRVTDGDPCFFCAMLASRGATYRSEESGGFEAHDGCGCAAEPVYGNSALPGRAGEFRAMWNDATRGESGKDAVRAFRRAYEKS